ncbi:MAG: transketolase [Bacillota bacterium]
MDKIAFLRKKAIEIRMELLRMICRAKSGHLGGSLSCADILVCLYYHVMKLDPRRPDWPDRDRFILSKGHSVEGYYAILADCGFFPSAELDTYGCFGTRLAGHPCVKVPGIEMNTGALGHGLSVGVGMALAGRMDGRDYRVFVLMGDGEQAEGSVWEAAMAAGHYRLGNLIGIIDRNKLQISGFTENVMALEPLKAKWTSFGWNVAEADGHDMAELAEVFSAVALKKDRPGLIIAHTVKGKGLSFAENEARWHHGIPDEEQLAAGMEDLRRQLREACP